MGHHERARVCLPYQDKNRPVDPEIINLRSDYMGRSFILYYSLENPGTPDNGFRICASPPKDIEDLLEKQGYQFVSIPHIASKELYEKSGHLEKFANDMFPIMKAKGREVKSHGIEHHEAKLNDTKFSLPKQKSQKKKIKRQSEATY